MWTFNKKNLTILIHICDDDHGDDHDDDHGDDHDDDHGDDHYEDDEFSPITSFDFDQLFHQTHITKPDQLIHRLKKFREARRPEKFFASLKLSEPPNFTNLPVFHTWTCVFHCAKLGGSENFVKLDGSKSTNGARNVSKCPVSRSFSYFDE